MRSRSVTGTSYCTSTSAVAPSAETRGGLTASTWGSAPGGRTAGRGRRRQRSPWRSWTTTCAEALPKAGMCARSRSVPRLGACLRDVPVLLGLSADDGGEAGHGRGHDHPRGEGAPGMGGGEPGERAQDAVHRVLLRSGPGACVRSRDPTIAGAPCHRLDSRLMSVARGGQVTVKCGFSRWRDGGRRTSQDRRSKR